MSSVLSVHKTTITGEELAPLICKLEQAASGENCDHVVIALLAMALVMVYPEITPEQLQKAVSDVSAYICMLVAPVEGDPQLVN